MATAKGTRPGAKSAQICMWKAQPNSLNNSKIINIFDSTSDDDLVIEDSFNLPIQSFSTESNSWAYVISAVASAKKPVRFFNSSKLMIFLQDPISSISNVSLKFIGTGVTDSTQIFLDKFITEKEQINPQDTDHNLLIMFICVVLLIVVASIVGTILYLREKSADEISSF